MYLCSASLMIEQKAMKNTNDSLEEQKQELIDLAERKFGEEYFSQLEKSIMEYEEEEGEHVPEYSLTVNCKGAFYAN